MNKTKSNSLKQLIPIKPCHVPSVINIFEWTIKLIVEVRRQLYFTGKSWFLFAEGHLVFKSVIHSFLEAIGSMKSARGVLSSSRLTSDQGRWYQFPRLRVQYLESVIRKSWKQKDDLRDFGHGSSPIGMVCMRSPNVQETTYSLEWSHRDLQDPSFPVVVDFPPSLVGCLHCSWGHWDSVRGRQSEFPCRRFY